MSMVYGTNGIDPDSGDWVPVEGEGEGPDMPTPTHERWPRPILAEGLKGSASQHHRLTDPRSESGPCSDHVIRNKPRPTRDEMPASWVWLCGPT